MGWTRNPEIILEISFSLAAPPPFNHWPTSGQFHTLKKYSESIYSSPFLQYRDRSGDPCFQEANSHVTVFSIECSHLGSSPYHPWSTHIWLFKTFKELSLSETQTFCDLAISCLCSLTFLLSPFLFVPAKWLSFNSLSLLCPAHLRALAHDVLPQVLDIPAFLLFTK